MSMEYIGPAKGNGKAVFLISVRTTHELPRAIQLPCPRFVLLLIHDATNRSYQDRLWDTLGHLLNAGCVYLCTWGPDCEYVHDLMDELIVMRDLEKRWEGSIMTTWHNKEPLDDALAFAVMVNSGRTLCRRLRRNRRRGHRKRCRPQ
jgi:hypothetical protein